MCACLQGDLLRHISRLHSDLSVQEQTELVSVGKLSSVELARNEALAAVATAICTDGISTPYQPVSDFDSTPNKRRKRQRQKLSYYGIDGQQEQVKTAVNQIFHCCSVCYHFYYTSSLLSAVIAMILYVMLWYSFNKNRLVQFSPNCSPKTPVFLHCKDFA